jgi:hypothetical protein
MAGTNNTVVISFSIGLFVLLIVLLVFTYNSKCQMDNNEKFDAKSYVELHNELKASNAYANTQGSVIDPMKPLSVRTQDGILESDPYGNSEYRQALGSEANANLFAETQVAGACVSRDRLTSADLLPLDANSKWAELNPQCSGDIQDQNYLTAGYHIGINTVGQSMRNANLQLRFEPPNPQIPVSPWMVSTIEPDSRTHGLMDIGSAPV